MSHRAFIFIGSNIRRDEYYLRAIEKLRTLGVITATSSVYDTAALGSDKNAPRFYNGAVLLETELGPRALRDELREIESELGRARTSDPDAPRTIDLDLALYDHVVIADRDLHLPDPHIGQRGFMASALAEIDPGYIVPTLGTTLEGLAEQAGGKNEIKDETMTEEVRKRVFAYHREGAEDG